MKKEAPAEAISKVVANLPAEQMFELMKEMKECLANNPVEARNMLLQNPQLTYALLQAQVVMSIVDPEIVVKNLYLNQIDKSGQNNSGAQGASNSSTSLSKRPTSSTQQNNLGSSADQEKEQLIKQVMNLTNEQIQMLPPDQRIKIIELREQLKRQ